MESPIRLHFAARAVVPHGYQPGDALQLVLPFRDVTLDVWPAGVVPPVLPSPTPTLYLTGPRVGGPSLDDLLALFRTVTGREPTPDDIEAARARLADRSDDREQGGA